MNAIQAYSKAHEKQHISRQIQKLSYILNKLESRFDIEQLNTKELEDLIEAYDRIFRNTTQLLTQLQNDQKQQGLD